MIDALIGTMQIQLEKYKPKEKPIFFKVIADVRNVELKNALYKVGGQRRRPSLAGLYDEGWRSLVHEEADGAHRRRVPLRKVQNRWQKIRVARDHARW